MGAQFGCPPILAVHGCSVLSQCPLHLCLPANPSCRCYRVVPAELFLAHFTSDRSHMRDASGGWLQPPPPWPCIEGGQAVAARAEAAGDGGGHSGTSVCGSNTLPAFLAFPPTEQLGRGNQQRAAPWLGSVMTEPTLLAAFGVG